MKIQKLVFSAVCVCLIGSNFISSTNAEGKEYLYKKDTKYILNLNNGEGNVGVFKGESFRQKLLTMTKEKFQGATGAAESNPPQNLKKCTVNDEYGKNYPNLSGNAQSKYYGQLRNKADFLKIAALECNGGYQFFNIGDAVFYRDCETNENQDDPNDTEKVSYIMYWGKSGDDIDDKDNICFDSSYPGMYKIYNSSYDEKKPSSENDIYKNDSKELQKIYQLKGDDGGDNNIVKTKEDIALANSMSAILIAESYRDYLIYPINFMLIDMGIRQKKFNYNNNVSSTNDIYSRYIIGGRKFHFDIDKDQKNDGVHPLAWGGAKKYTMQMVGGKRQWGHENGATSDNGIKLELGVIFNWLESKGFVTKVNGEQDVKSASEIPDKTFDEVFAEIPSK